MYIIWFGCKHVFSICEYLRWPQTGNKTPKYESNTRHQIHNYHIVYIPCSQYQQLIINTEIKVACQLKAQLSFQLSSHRLMTSREVNNLCSSRLFQLHSKLCPLCDMAATNILLVNESFSGLPKMICLICWQARNCVVNTKCNFQC